MNPLSESLHYLQITELALLIERRKISPLDVTRAQLDRIAALDGELMSYAVVTPDAALAEAKAAEAEIAAGAYRGPLHGVPIALKDLFWTKDAPAAGGMALYRDFRPPRDATAVERLRRAGAIILGKLQMTEGAYSDHHPSITPPSEPLEPGLLDRHLFQRPSSRDSRRSLLWRARLRHGRLDPLALRSERADGSQAHMG